LVQEGRWEGELVHTRRDGTQVVVDSRWVLDRDPGGEPRAVLEINRDTTERKAAEEAVRESEARFRAVFEAAAIGIGLADMEGRYVESNAALQEMVGYSADELRGVSFGDFTHPADASRDVELYEELVGGRRDHYQVETRIIRKDGRVGWARITRSLIRGADGRPRYSIAMAEDLRLALVDDLTGLNNRRAFLTLAQHQLALSRRNGTALILLFIDVDGMKEINDSLGHTQGDRALIDAATVLTRTFRESDLVARVGGDEFCVLLTNVNGHSDELPAISRLREAVNRYRAESSRPYVLSLSVGASRFDPKGQQSLGELIDLADRSMYEEKARRPADGP
jgi:diguanylate cyclase (GGDEF)-like protein/PAS domain S-box-containing protein